ncbi:odorant receptor 47a-like [Drosophila nasuta]|uniref:odorant receptor 47a-like n=1 Tax=Drosophila nasuta TaxID=42062 RepID=UPI00295E710E|nr:odorant receptor 47a-like [Drosophila nasuta]
MHTLTEDFLKVQGTSFRILGFDIVDGRNGWLHPCRTTVMMTALIVVQPMIVVFVLQNVENLDNLTDGIGSMLVDLLALLKFSIIMWLRKDLKRLVAKCRNMLEKECLDEVSASIISQENQSEQRVSGIYKNSFMLTAILSSLMPIVNTFIFYWQTGYVELQLTFPCAYPWDDNNMSFALLSYVLLVCASFSAILPTICIDTYFTALTHNLVALYKSAQFKMQLFGVKTLEETQERLREILQLYKNILDMSDALNRFFRLTICMQLIVASLLLCFIGYTLSENFAQPKTPFYATFMFSVLTQLYIYCYCGEYLKTESRRFANAIYNSLWYEATAVNPTVGRSLQISMMRAQRGSRIDGYFFEANMRVFLSIVKTALSYLALLRSIS